MGLFYNAPEPTRGFIVRYLATRAPGLLLKEVGTGPWSFAKYPENCYCAPVGERSIVMCMYVCLSVRGSASVCPPSYTSRLRQVLLHVSYGRDSHRSCFGGVAIRCVVPVVRTTPCSRAMAKYWSSEKGVCSKRHQTASTDFTPPHIQEMTHQCAAPSRGRSQISAIS